MEREAGLSTWLCVLGLCAVFGLSTEVHAMEGAVHSSCSALYALSTSVSIFPLLFAASF